MQKAKDCTRVAASILVIVYFGLLTGRAYSATHGLSALFDAVSASGTSYTIAAEVAQRTGLGSQDIQAKEVTIDVAGVRHQVEVFAANGQPYVAAIQFLNFRQPGNHWSEGWVLFLDLDGNLQRAFHRAPGKDLAPEGADLVASSETDFWLRWVNSGAELPSNSR